MQIKVLPLAAPRADYIYEITGRYNQYVPPLKYGLKRKCKKGCQRPECNNIVAEGKTHCDVSCYTIDLPRIKKKIKEAN